MHVYVLSLIDFSNQYIRFKSPDYSSQKGKRFTKQNKKVLNSLNRKIFRRASKLLQSHWPRRYFLSLHISKQKIICKSILSWPVEFEKKELVFVPNVHSLHSPPSFPFFLPFSFCLSLFPHSISSLPPFPSSYFPFLASFLIFLLSFLSSIPSSFPSYLPSNFFFPSCFSSFISFFFPSCFPSSSTFHPFFLPSLKYPKKSKI